MHKFTEMPARRGIWLYSYEYVRNRTPFFWFASSFLGALALIGGIVFGWLTWFSSPMLEVEARLFRSIIPVTMLAYGILEFPPGIIYLSRRWRGLPADLWDYETPDDPSVQERLHKK